MGRLRFWNVCSSVMFLAGTALFLAGCLLDERFASPWCAAGGAVILVSMVLGIVKLRCPFCHHFLGLLFSPSPRRRHCPRCGCDMEQETQEPAERAR